VIRKLKDKKEARAYGGRRFQKKGPATKKDLDLAKVVLDRGTKNSLLSRERRGRRDEAEGRSRVASRRYLGATLNWAFHNNTNNSSQKLTKALL